MKGILIQKINSEPGDATENGTFGKAILWVDTPEEMRKQFPDVDKMYAVVWDDKPALALVTVGPKVDVIDSVPVECKLHEEAKNIAENYKKIMPIFNYFK